MPVEILRRTTFPPHRYVRSVPGTCKHCRSRASFPRKADGSYGPPQESWAAGNCRRGEFVPHECVVERADIDALLERLIRRAR